MRRAVAFALVAAAGCALAPVRPEGFVCPVRGGPAWTEVRTEHFLLRTDLPAATAGAFARELEDVHATYRAFFGGRAPAGVVPVTAMRTARAYRELGLPDSQAITLVGEPGLRVAIAASPVLVGFSRMERAQIIQKYEESGRMLAATGRHELGHVFAMQTMPLQPAWLQEGLASFLEGSRLEGGRARFGKASEERRWELEGETVAVQTVLEQHEVVHSRVFYVSSLRLVGALVAHHRAAFDGYLAALARGDDPRHAWRAAFPQYDLDVPATMKTLDALASSWKGDVDAFDLEAPAPGRVLDSRVLPAAEVHAERLEVMLAGSAAGPFRTEAAEALAEDPGCEPALLVDAFLAPEADREARLRAALARKPGSARLAFALMRFAPEAEHDALLEQALRGGPTDGLQRTLLAHWLAGKGRAAEALPLAERATAEVPFAWRGWYALAEAKAGLGRCDEAAKDLKLVEEMAPERKPAGWSIAELNAQLYRCRTARRR